jgi:hypothetical protein
VSSEPVTELWHRITAHQQAPQSPVILAAGAGALALVALRPAWGLARHLITIAHEGAHGAVALLVGRRLAGIRLHSDTSGLTVSAGKPRGLGMVLTFLAGYLGPALFGLGAAALLSARHAVGVLWAVLALLALLLLQIRNWFGLWSVLVTGAAVFAVSWWLPERAQSGFAYLIAFFLLFAAPRPVLELQAKRRRGGARGSDADQLASLTRLPGIVWVAVFLVATLAAGALGAFWLSAPLRS